MKNFILPILSLSILSGCASMAGGQMQDVTIKTPGASNAKCYIENEDMKYQVYTDQTVKIMKSPHDLIVRCVAPGNREQTVHVKRDVNDWVVANVANGFVPGAAYDYFSRGAFEYPETITVSFIGERIKQYPLPAYMSDDLRENHQYGNIEYMGPGVMVTDIHKGDKPAPLQKKQNPYALSTTTDSAPQSEKTGVKVDSIHRQYNPSVSYDPTEEDK